MYRNLLAEFLVYTPIEEIKRIRMGKGDDGGYVLLLHKLDDVECFYSYGIKDDYSFDQELSEFLQVPGRLFDPSVNFPEKISERLFFRKIGLATGQGSISDHIKSFGDQGKRAILKLDIEASEWQWLITADISDFEPFDQIVIEYHCLHLEKYYNVYLHALKKINSLFYLYHVHGNNYGPLFKKDGFEIPVTLECSYIRKSLCECEVNRTILFPIEGIDHPNNPSQPDYKLHCWPFISKSNLNKS